MDAVTLKDGQVFCIRGSQREALTDILKLPFEVEIATNGTFTVASGKERTLAEGQVIRNDGWLMDPDGSIQPVFDHVAMRAGRVTVVRDGKAEALTEVMTFPNHLSIAPDASCVYPSGNRTRLTDGQFFRLDGTSVPGKDTATLKNGRVVVLKDGTLITLMGFQIMGMNDGSRVQGDGLVTQPNGTVIRLSEGQTIFIDGVATRH